MNEECTLEELFNGKLLVKKYKRLVNCKPCNTTGFSDGIDHKCKTCNGSGHITQIMRMGPMIQQIRKPCGSCRGNGLDSGHSHCDKCKGKGQVEEENTIRFNIPVGAFNNSTIIIENQGNENKTSNGNYGNIKMHIKEKSHSRFIRGFAIKNIKESDDQSDLLIEIQITLAESICGFSREIEYLDGSKFNIVSDDYVKTNDVKVIPNYGMPRLQGRGRGNLFVNFKIDYPKEKLGISARRKVWQNLTGGTLPDFETVNNKQILEPNDKYKSFNNNTNRNQQRQGMPFPPGFNPFGGSREEQAAECRTQ
jgi:DnaJ family protein A protein 2